MVYHGSPWADFNTFQAGNGEGAPIYFATDRDMADYFAHKNDLEEDDFRELGTPLTQGVYEVFLNARNIINLGDLGTMGEETYNRIKSLLNISEEEMAFIQHDPKYTVGYELLDFKERFNEIVRERGYDGVYGFEGGSYEKGGQFAVYNPNQIKSATDNNGEFSTGNNDIRFAVRSIQGRESMIEDGKTRFIEPQEAIKFHKQMKDEAEPLVPRELTKEIWDSEIAGRVFETPIGNIRFGENQYSKNEGKNRANEFGMLLPTVLRPDVIFEEYDPVAGAERQTKFVFVKTISLINGKKHTNYTSVSVQKEGMEVITSSHHLRDKQVLNKIEKEQMLWNRFDIDSKSLAQGSSIDQNNALSDNKP